jgi:cytochrome c biogenesis protein CcmG, thiol:disulfide interchange protein DsbE
VRYRSTLPLLGLALLLAPTLRTRAEVKRLDTLTVGTQTYSNVTITSLTPSDVYFTHSRGLANAKLNRLDPALQNRLGFDAAQATRAQQDQTRSQARYLQTLGTPPPATNPVPQAEITARSLLNQPAPTIVAEQWLSPAPDLRGKFILLEFWATWSDPCRRAIPSLNALHARFKDRLAIIGLSNEPEAVVRKMTDPAIDYAVAIDRQHRASSAVGVERVPYALLVDPRGIVRFEGHPGYLEADQLEQLLATYFR